jgi:hypothetical protein
MMGFDVQKGQGFFFSPLCPNWHLSPSTHPVFIGAIFLGRKWLEFEADHLLSFLHYSVMNIIPVDKYLLYIPMVLLSDCLVYLMVTKQ